MNTVCSDKNPVSGLRRMGAGVIRTIALIAALSSLWQIVRFWQGDVGLPLLDKALAAYAIEPLRPTIGDGPLGVLSFVYGGLAGTAYWAFVGMLLSQAGVNIAFIVKHGWHHWKSIQASSAMEARKRGRLARLRDLRRQARAKRTGGLFAVLVGFALGVWLS